MQFVRNCTRRFPSFRASLRNARIVNCALSTEFRPLQTQSRVNIRFQQPIAYTPLRFYTAVPFTTLVSEAKCVPLVFEHVDAAADILTSKFCSGNEPIIRGCGISYEEFYPWVHLQCQRSSQQELSTVCLVNGEVAAAFLSEDLKAPTVPDEDPFYTTPKGAGMVKFAPAAELIGQLEHKLFADHPEWDKDKQGVFYHQWMVAVSKKFARRGLCNKIYAAGLQQAAANGFTTAIVECTGKFSLAGALKAGYVEHNRIMYSNFEFNGAKPFSNSERDTGHNACVLCIRNLK